jgi:hypothetical protein
MELPLGVVFAEQLQFPSFMCWSASEYLRYPVRVKFLAPLRPLDGRNKHLNMAATSSKN